MLQFYKSFYHQAPAHMLDQFTIVTDVVLKIIRDGLRDWSDVCV